MVAAPSAKVPREANLEQGARQTDMGMSHKEDINLLVEITEFWSCLLPQHYLAYAD